MIFPNNRRRNSRYRGSVESKKMDNFYNEVSENLKELYEKINTQEIKSKKLNVSLEGSNTIKVSDDHEIITITMIEDGILDLEGVK